MKLRSDVISTLVAIHGDHHSLMQHCELRHGGLPLNRRHTPPIWVVNLKRSADRRERMRAQLNALGLQYEFVEAVDGNELSGHELATWYQPSEASALINRGLTRGEVGCSLSHLRLYERLIKEGHDEAVILEDDVVVDPAFLEIMGHRDSLSPDCELVMFHRVNNPLVSCWGSRPFDRRHRCVKFAGFVDGTLGYLLRQSAARKLLVHGFPVRVPADGLTGGIVKTNVRLWGIHPPCIRHDAFGASHSTMPESYALRPKPPGRSAVGTITWLRMKAERTWRRSIRSLDPRAITGGW